MVNHFQKIVQDIGSKIPVNSKNALRIEKCLLKLCSLIEGPKIEDQIETDILKRHKISNDLYSNKPAKIIGYRPSDFRKLQNYNPDAFKIPLGSSDFEEAKKINVP